MNSNEITKECRKLSNCANQERLSMGNLLLSEIEVEEAANSVRSLFTGSDMRLLNSAINELSALTYDEWQRNGFVVAFYLFMNKDDSCDEVVLFEVQERKVSVVNKSKIEATYNCEIDRYYDFIYPKEV